MNTRDELASAIRELAAAALELAAAVRGVSRNGASNETADPVHWSETDVAFAQRALRPLSDIAPEERSILERMRQRLRKTTPSPEPKK